MSENNPTHSYFFRLQPLGKFFFGNERTFGEGAEANYLVRSNPFPQQTTLLGMLRFEILKSHNSLFPISVENEKDVKKKIGSASFDHKQESSFGIIERLSPVLIADANNSAFYPASKTVAYPEYAEMQQKAYRWMNGQFVETSQFNFPDYDYKTYYGNTFHNFAGSRLREDEIFFSDSQIGIQVKANEEQNKGFYKQFFYRMRPGYAFCFWGQFSEELNFSNQFVTLGADRSTFRLEVMEADWESDFLAPYTSVSTNQRHLLLLSDAWVPDDFYEHCRFAVADTIDFRYVKSMVRAGQNYSNKPVKSKVKLNLLQRGSVIYPKNMAEVKKKLDNTIFQKIGYNYYRSF